MLCIRCICHSSNPTGNLSNMKNALMVNCYESVLCMTHWCVCVWVCVYVCWFVCVCACIEEREADPCLMEMAPTHTRTHTHTYTHTHRHTLIKGKYPIIHITHTLPMCTVIQTKEKTLNGKSSCSCSPHPQACPRQVSISL